MFSERWIDIPNHLLPLLHLQRIPPLRLRRPKELPALLRDQRTRDPSIINDNILCAIESHPSILSGRKFGNLESIIIRIFFIWGRPSFHTLITCQIRCGFNSRNRMSTFRLLFITFILIIKIYSIILLFTSFFSCSSSFGLYLDIVNFLKFRHILIRINIVLFRNIFYIYNFRRFKLLSYFLLFIFWFIVF